MKQLYADLWQTEAEHPFPDFPQGATHAYLLLRQSGNVLFYSTAHAQEREEIRKLGGISHQYLSHIDEAGPALATIKSTFGSKLASHRLEADAVAEHCAVDIRFDQHKTYGDIDVIPTPGHTPGSVCFLVTSPEGKRYLFTGDTLFADEHGVWQAGLLPFSDVDALYQSIRSLRELSPDVVISSASGGRVPYQEMAAGEWPALIDEVLQRLEKQRDKRKKEDA